MSPSVLSIAGVEKRYGALRPLRIESLEVAAGTLVAITGIDAPGAEMFTNLATGAVLPEEGEVRVFGVPTSAITDPDEWLRSLDRVGILTDRAVLIDGYTAAQNLAMPLTLEVDPLSDDLRARVATVAREAGVEETVLERTAGALGALDRVRVRFGRALALRPALVLMEHPTASLAPAEAAAFAADVRRAFRARGLAGVAITTDRAFATAAGATVLQLRGADGALVPWTGGRAGLRRLFGR